MQVIRINAFVDNYFWILDPEDNQNTVAAVDPGSFREIDAWCQEHSKVVTKIFVTHHHSDHVGGIKLLKEKYRCKVYAHAFDRNLIEDVDHWLHDGDEIEIGGNKATVKSIPGHTPGHICYWFKNLKLAFVGDTLFALGCGRLFGGTPDQMWESLKWIRSLPSGTLIYCAHEYTLSNLKFVQSLVGSDLKLDKREEKLQKLRKNGQSTVPFLIEEDRQTNPFLKCDEDHFAAKVSCKSIDPVHIFSFIRTKKDNF